MVRVYARRGILIKLKLCWNKRIRKSQRFCAIRVSFDLDLDLDFVVADPKSPIEMADSCDR